MDVDISKEDCRKRVEHYLQHNGLKKTIERFAVLDAIMNWDGHFSVDELYDFMMRNDVLKVSRATLYNHIDLFYKMGVVIKHVTGLRSEQYEWVGRGSHAHLVCTHCGRMEEMTLTTPIKPAQQCRTLGFECSNVSVTIYGLCKDCNNKIKKSRK